MKNLESARKRRTVVKFGGAKDLAVRQSADQARAPKARKSRPTVLLL